MLDTINIFKRPTPNLNYKDEETMIEKTMGTSKFFFAKSILELSRIFRFATVPATHVADFIVPFYIHRLTYQISRFYKSRENLDYPFISEEELDWLQLKYREQAANEETGFYEFQVLQGKAAYGLDKIIFNYRINLCAERFSFTIPTQITQADLDKQYNDIVAIYRKALNLAKDGVGLKEEKPIVSNAEPQVSFKDRVNRIADLLVMDYSDAQTLAALVISVEKSGAKLLFSTDLSGKIDLSIVNSEHLDPNHVQAYIHVIKNILKIE